MRFSKRAVRTAIMTTIVLALFLAVGAGVGIVKLFPAAWTWVQNVLGGANIDAARRAVADVGAQLLDDRLVGLSRTSEGAAALAALAGNAELAQLLKWTTAIPGLGSLVQSGAYQQAIEEAVRQNVPNISEIRLDQVVSPETRTLLAEVQQVMANNPQAAEAASVVNANVLNLLKSDAFARLRQIPEFSRLLTDRVPAGGAE